MSLELAILRLAEASESVAAATRENTAAMLQILGTAGRMPVAATTPAEAPAAEPKTTKAKATAKALVPPVETKLEVVPDPDLDDDAGTVEVVTIEDLRAEIRPRMKEDGYKAKFGTVRVEFGVEELSQLTEDQYAPFLAAMKAIPKG